MILTGVHIGVVNRRLLLVMQILVKRALVVGRERLHVGVQLAHIHVIVITAFVVFVSLMVVSVIVVSRQIAVCFLVFSSVVESA